MEEGPNSWWEKYKDFYYVKERVDRFFLGLFLAVGVEGVLQFYLYSGFVQFLNNQYYWVSAKHSILNIFQVLNYSGVKIEAFRWIDRSEIDGANSIPVNHRNLQYFVSEDFDIGVIVLEGFSLEALKSNEKFIFITDHLWFNSETIIPDGFCLIGFPEGYGKLSPPDQVSDSQYNYDFQSNLSYIPLELIPDKQIENQRGSSANSFWSDSSAFYARIITEPDITSVLPSSIVGMSGGPVISFSLNSLSKEVSVNLVGIQSIWLKEQKTIRAEPISRLKSFL